MSYVSTKIMEALLKNEPIEEVFRQELESAINRLLVIELDSFLNYDRYDPAGLTRVIQGTVIIPGSCIQSMEIWISGFPVTGKACFTRRPWHLIRETAIPSKLPSWSSTSMA